MSPDPAPPGEGVSCDIPGCSEASHRSLATAEARKAFPTLGETRRTHLCKAHYKEWKKSTRKERELERLGR